MKVAIVFLAMLACFVAADKYTTKYDNIDVDQILKSDRLLNNYVNCLLDVGNCTPDGHELKKTHRVTLSNIGRGRSRRGQSREKSLPDALANGCNKCSEKQKAGSEKVIRYLVNQRPKLWEKLSTKYDPTGEYKEKFQNEAEKHGIKL